MSFVDASCKAGVGYCASDNKWLVADALQISTGLSGTKVEPAWTIEDIQFGLGPARWQAG